MNKFLKVMFALVIVAMTGAAILQIVAPEYMGSNAAYGISTGWQREIGFWNLAVLIILVTTCFHYDWVYLRAILLALILGGIGIGTNHFIHFLSAHESVNLVGAIENYVLAVGWMIGWKLECNRRKTVGATE
ncbi:hypothetical protein [Atopobium sp. ICM42b]|uniref:hypothetical protein n=1 Tax=Atopobium sp. ICM42b TaxID=1190620 RepID=UPI0004B4C5D7|nr:hypothetical protein [Atopobium sp. ICM42b]